MGGFVGGLFGGGSSTPSQPNVQVYQPSGTSSQDSNLQSLLNQNFNTVGANNPYAQYAPQFGQVYNSVYSSPYAQPYQASAGNAGTGYTNTGNTALMNSSALSGYLPQLLSGATSTMNMGLDPQQALYNQQLQQTNDRANVTNAQYGLTGQQAAGNVNQADTNFNIDWQNNELQRAISGLTAGSAAGTSAGALANTAAGVGNTGAGSVLQGGATPYGAGVSIAGQQQSALQDYIAALLGPATSSQQTIQNQQNYLNTGVNASAAGASAALGDYNAQLTNSSNLGSGLGNILGLENNSGGTLGGSLLGALGLGGSSGGNNGVGTFINSFDQTAFDNGLPWSDRRLKRDVIELGELDDLPVYAFKYLWGNEINIGHMADEVEELYPSAVILHPSGFKQVNYALVG